MPDIVFLDTETLGLDPDAPVWDFAAVRRDQHGFAVAEVEFRIRHDPDPWLETLPDRFLRDYAERYVPADAWAEADAARVIHALTDGVHLVGCNPGFDTERLAKLLRRNDLEPAWHYHPNDIASMGRGYLAAVARLTGETQVPNKSDHIALGLGVNPADYARHTAMGDVLWTMAQWDAVMP